MKHIKKPAWIATVNVTSQKIPVKVNKIISNFSDLNPHNTGRSIWLESLKYSTFAIKNMIDPIELRWKNYSERDPNEDKPCSSKELRACCRLGAER